MGQSDPDHLNPLQTEDFLPPINRWMQGGGLVLAAACGAFLLLAMMIQVNVKVRAIAEVRPGEDLEVLRSEVTGTVEQLNVNDNQTVQTGDAIAHLTIPDLIIWEQTQVDLSNAIARLEQDQQVLTAQQQALVNQIILEATEQSDRPLPEDPTAAFDSALARLATLRSPAYAQGLLERYDRITEDLQNSEQQLQEQQQAQQQLETWINQQVVRSPTNGTILQLGVERVGQSVEPGLVIAEILPENGRLLIRAQVTVQDIGRVELGQLAQMRVSAYPYPDYGVLDGTVTAIASDTVPCDRSTCIAPVIYELEIEPAQNHLVRDGISYPLQPGMEVSVDIISRRERLIVLLLREIRLNLNW